MSEKTRYDAPQPAGQAPPGYKLPTKRHLLEATGLAALMAALLLVLFILPAEYGIDPTGLGEATGLNSLSQDAGGEIDLGGRAGSLHRTEPSGPRNDTFTFTVDGLQASEFKLHMLANQSIVYRWTSTGPVNYDFHGEPDNPSRPGEFSSYDAAQGTARNGSFQAPFDGRQGWYFRNVSGESITITLHTWGYYDVIGQV